MQTFLARQVLGARTSHLAQSRLVFYLVKAFYLLGIGLLQLLFPIHASSEVLLDQKFTADPKWRTDQPTNFYWKSDTETYFARTQSGYFSYRPNRYSVVSLPHFDPTKGFLLRWDQKINILNPYSVVFFGMFSDDLLSYGSTYIGLPPLVPESMTGIGLGMMGSSEYTSQRLYTLERNLTTNGTHGQTYQPGIWYRFTIEYDPLLKEMRYQSIERDTGTLMTYYNSTASIGDNSFSGGMRNVGISNNDVGYNPNQIWALHPEAFAETEFDNVYLEGQRRSSAVIFLHGIMGSRLYACESSDGTTWSDREIWPTSDDGTLAKLSLPDGSLKRVYVGPLLDEVTAFDVNIYKRFEAFMKKEFPGQWEALTYDWRLSYDDILDTGSRAWDPIARCGNTNPPKGMLERVRDILNGLAPGGKLIIVTHSNGGLLAKRLVQRLELEEATRGRVEKLIFVAAPHFGAPKAIGALLHGTGFPLPSVEVSRDEYRKVVRTTPSGYLLLPSRSYFQINPFADQPASTVAAFASGLAETLFGTPGKPYAGSAYAAVDADAELSALVGWTTPYGVCPSSLNCNLAPVAGDPSGVSKAINVHSGPQQTAPEYPGIDSFVAPQGTAMYQIAGTGLDTVRLLRYAMELGPQYSSNFWSSRDETTGFGDGTVPFRSGLAVAGAESFAVRLDNSNLFTLNNCAAGLNKNRQHHDILELTKLQNLLARIIRGQATDAGALGEASDPKKRCIDPLGILTAQPPRAVWGIDLTHATLYSPADLHVFDATGAHTGPKFTPTPGTSFRVAEAGIQGSSFEFPHRASLNTQAGPYRYEVRGTGTGVFTLAIDRRIDDVQTERAVYPDVPVTPKTVAWVSMATPSERPALSVDVDGDGRVDVQVPAVASRPPVAIATGPSTARLGSMVTLSGAQSYDPDDGPAQLRYAWSTISGPGTTLVGSNTLSPTLIPATAGTYGIRLVVDDSAVASVPAKLGIVVPRLGDIDMDGDVDSVDLGRINSALNTNASGPNDLRDLDGDGRITGLDARKLVTLCTRPRCATQ